MSGSSSLIDVGRIGPVFGVKGWVKIHSFTEPAGQLFDYAPWWLKTAHGVRQIEIDEYRPHGKGFVAHVKDVDDRDQAALYTGVTIAVDSALLPSLEAGEYYWHQLENLRVISSFEGQTNDLGHVARMLETGANDVLVVAPDSDSMDDRERLIPYVPGQYVLAVDLEAGSLTVDWDPEF